MLNRDRDESQRLDTQHSFARALAHGLLIHPSIPHSDLRSIADVGTGTGIWLRDITRETAESGKSIQFTGFDVSAHQFPEDDTQGINFAVHNVVDPFPGQYHEAFDLVYVRFLSYAIKACGIEKAVTNIVEIIRKSSLCLA